MTEKYPNAPDFPFCGSSDLSDTDWLDDDGEFDAIECNDCKGSEPAEVWCGNTRPKSEAEELLEWFDAKTDWCLVWWPSTRRWRVLVAWNAEGLWLPKQKMGEGKTPIDALRAAREASDE